MRLTPDHWIAAGLEALQTKGPSALSAEPLARAMGTTKGSFYWHFADVPTFQRAVMAAWLTQTQSALADHVAGSSAPDQRLRQFGQAVLRDQTEAAMRTWARTDDHARATLQQCDADRLTYITLLLREMGLANVDFARALQAALIGLPQITSEASQAQTTFDTLVDTVLAL